MQTLVAHGPHQLTFENPDPPLPGPGQVLVQTHTVGICGSDIHLYEGRHPYRVYPNVYGHEAAGVVVEVGDDVDALQPGDRVALEPLIWCGECFPCRTGRTNCCVNMRTIGVTEPGAMRDRFVAPAHTLHKLPADLPLELAALAEPYSIGFQACARGPNHCRRPRADYWRGADWADDSRRRQTARRTRRHQRSDRPAAGDCAEYGRRPHC